MPNFQGQLRSNEIFSSIYNMIISQQVFAKNIAGTFSSLVDKARVDGGLYGDQKLYYSTDALKTKAWGNDAEATNLLALNRPIDPSCQSIVLDQFRIIDLTVDNYLSKRAWGDEYAFSSFNSVMLGWLRTTKRIYDSVLYNSFVGTAQTTANRAIVEVDVTTATTGLTGESKARVEAQTIAKAMADLFIDMRDVSRDFNDYKYLRSYDLSDLVVVWNSDWVNKITKLDLPTIFHKDNLMDKFNEEVLPARFFGHIATSADVGSGKVIDEHNKYDNTKGTIRSLVEKDYIVGSTTYHVFPGDELQNQATIGGSTANFKYAEVYIVCADIICKVMHKDAIPFMSAFEVGTTFFNQRSLTENHYLIWGYNTLEVLKELPLITVEKE